MCGRVLAMLKHFKWKSKSAADSDFDFGSDGEGDVTFSTCQNPASLRAALFPCRFSVTMRDDDYDSSCSSSCY